jgi:hypothetical protein
VPVVAAAPPVESNNAAAPQVPNAPIETSAPVQPSEPVEPAIAQAPHAERSRGRGRHVRAQRGHEVSGAAVAQQNVQPAQATQPVQTAPTRPAGSHVIDGVPIVSDLHP